MFRIKSRNYNLKTFFISLFVTVWLGIAFFLFQNIVFETNDDNAMARILYGLHSNAYDPHLVYINVIAGKLMVFLMKLWPSIPWYTVCQCGTVLLSFFVIVYLIFSRFGIRRGAFPVMLLVLFFGMEYCLKLQFTKTAGIAAFSGILLLLDASAHNASGRLWKYFLGGLLTVIGAMYRFNAFLMTLLPSFFVGLMLIWYPVRQKDWKRVIKICLPFVIVLFICFLCRQFNRWEYQQSTEWAYYQEFNSLRSQLLDYGFPDYTMNQALYESLNISKSDLSVFKGWDFADPDVFTVDAMRQLVAAKEKTVFVFKDFAEFIKEFLLDYRYSAAIWISVAVSVLFLRRKREILLFVVFLTVFGIQLYLYTSGRYGANRVDVTLAMILYIIPVLYCWDIPYLPKRALSGVLAMLLLLSPFADYQEKQVSDVPAPIYSLMHSDADKLYLRTVVSGIPLFPAVNSVHSVGFQLNSFGLGGWETYSVPYIDKMAHFSISNPYRDMVDNPNVFFIPGSLLDTRLDYIRRHYYADATAHLVKITEDGHKIYRISTATGPTLDAAQAVYGNGVDSIEYAFAAESADGNTRFHGYLFEQGKNSFASSIYLSLTDNDGAERFYYTTQSYTDALGDLMNGQYSVFTQTLPNPVGAEFIKLYLEVDDCLYCIHIGTVEQVTVSAAIQ